MGNKLGTASAPDAFKRLGIRPIINAAGIFTDLGGSILSDKIWEQLTQLNEHYVDLTELLDSTGRSIAARVGSEAARVVPSASAGIALAVAACMTEGRPEAWEQLPDTGGLKSTVILQHQHAATYKYINPIRISGARVRVVGSATGTSTSDLVAAINEDTAALFVPAHLDGAPGSVPLGEVIGIGRDCGINVVVDAAYQVHPPEAAKRFSIEGADLVCFSAKYYGGPNAGGFVSGRTGLIETIAGLDFTNFESGPYRTFGRPFKMGRYDIAAVALALEQWFETDHGERQRAEARRALAIRVALSRTCSVNVELKCFTLDARLIDAPVNTAAIRLPSAESAKHLAGRLSALTPSIRTIVQGDRLLVVTETLRDHEVPHVVNVLSDLLQHGDDQ